MPRDDEILRQLGELPARAADARVRAHIHQRARACFAHPAVRAPVPRTVWVEIAAAGCAGAVLLGWALTTARAILG